jgi:uncharacterized damage-inducible protein DinB
MADRRTPLRLTTEEETLQEFLDYLRESVILKAEGLTEDAVRVSLVPSGTTLLGLVKHLVVVETMWLHYAFAGLDVDLGRDGLEPADTIASVTAAYRSTAEGSNRIIADCDDLERLCARTLTTPEPLSLRWVLVHLVEETARHAGHADILREQIDGSVGR